MTHLFICREYPPSPGGGIGTYTAHMARLLADAGETVHVITQYWDGAETPKQVSLCRRLIVHRVPCQDWTSFWGVKPHPGMASEIKTELFHSGYAPQSFTWQAALTAERLVEEEEIDIIEAPDYEASLYYFQLRRAMGLGPVKKPPCVVHLHSPTTLIAEANEWPADHHFLNTAIQMEAYSIAAADMLLCPSTYLANQMHERMGMDDERIRVIPYPLDNAARPSPAAVRRRDGPICYLGRLERRKGILEWVDAAVAAAAQDAAIRFDFVGVDGLRMDPLRGPCFIADRIPGRLRSRFRFHGDQPRERVQAFLDRARIAVIPSRWDNFPYACMEAMASGLPVIATRTGGMAEMIEDGRTGWLADQASPSALVEALRRAAATSPDALQAMGRQAAEAISRLCSGSHILDQHMAVRTRCVEQGAVRSNRFPQEAPWMGRAPYDLPVFDPRHASSHIMNDDRPSGEIQASDAPLPGALDALRLAGEVALRHPGDTVRHVLSKTGAKWRRLMRNS